MQRSGTSTTPGRHMRSGFNKRKPGITKNSTNRGLFAQGTWRCDCQPRLPAERFKVKKAGKNQGRWFYTCQHSEPQRCGFFLWEDEAKPREEAALLGNSRTEPDRHEFANGLHRTRPHPEEGWNAGRGLFASKAPNATARDDDESTQSPSPSPPQTTANRKRRASSVTVDNEEEETFPWPLTGEEERELVNTTDSGTFETPRKAQKTGVYATPATSAVKRRLSWVEESPQTPTTARIHMDDFITPSKPPITVAGHSAVHPQEPVTPGAPPTLATAASPIPPTRHRDALLDPNDSNSTLTSAVLATLSNHKVSLPPETLSELRTILTQHDLRTQGVVKGREISRLALRKKDGKIAELHERIASLEAEREVDRGLVRALKRAAGE